MNGRYIAFCILSAVLTFLSILIPHGSIPVSHIQNYEQRLGWVIPFAYQTTRWLDPPENSMWKVELHNPQNNAITIHWSYYILSVVILLSVMLLIDFGARRLRKRFFSRRERQLSS